MRLDLREEETGNYISLFQNYLEDVQNANKELYDVLNDILVLTKYEKIQQTISNMIDQYHELIVDNVSNNTYQQWIESNASLRSCLHTYEAGEDAEEICNQIQFELLELISETLKVEKEDFVITDRPEVSDEGIEQIKDAIEKALNQIADVKATYFIKINDKSDENDIYGTLLPLVNQICTTIEAFLEAAKEEIYKLHEFVIEQSNKLRDILENQGIINPDHAVNVPNTNINANIMPPGFEGTNSKDSPEDIDSFILKHVLNDVLGTSKIYGKSLWYSKIRRDVWKENENKRVPVRNQIILDKIKGMDLQVKEEWKEMISNNQLSGQLGYKEENDYLNMVLKHQENDCDYIEGLQLNIVEKARLWQGSFNAKKMSGQYKGRDTYELDRLDGCTKLYKLQLTDTLEFGSYFLVESEFLKIKDKSIDEIYSILQLNGFYENKDSLEFGYRKNIMEYEVKDGEIIDVARGLITENSHFNNTNTNIVVEQTFVASEDMKKLIDLKYIQANEGISAKSKSVRNKLIAFAHNLNKQSNRKSIEVFEKLTAYLYHLAYWEMFSKEKSLSNDMLGQIMTIYNHFYTEYGGHLRDGFSDPDKREAHIKEEYIGVTRDRGNEKYFEGEEKRVFYSHAHNTYQVFNTIANMMKNVIEGCKTGEADDNNLIYGLYVLFEPIKTGYILKGYENEYATFSRWAAEEILSILGEDISQLNNSDVLLHEKYEEADEIDVNDENFSEENMEKAILLIERIVEEIGVDTLNQSVEKNYDIMKEIYAIYGKKSGSESQTQSKMESKDEGNLYGRYTVNDESIQLMEGLCVETNSILEPLDQYYKDKFDKLDKNFDKTHKTIHTISSFLSLWGLGSWNLSKAPTDLIWDQIHLGSLPIALCPQMGLLITGGAHLVKLFDVIMPFTKKNKTLVKLNKKIWDLTREDIQAPYYNRAMDQYMMEHYEFKYRGKQDKAQFSYFHSVTEKIEEKSQRRAFENACFAAEGRLTNLNYTIVGDFNENEMREIDCGVFLNLLRSGMSSKQNILAEDANKITDQLYDIYAARESITPKVALNPVRRMISGNIS